MFNWLTQRTSVQEKLDMERSSLEQDIAQLQTQIGALSLDAAIGDKKAQDRLSKVQGDIALKHRRITEIDAAKEELAKRAKLAKLEADREAQQQARAKAATLHADRLQAAIALDEALLKAEQAFIAYENTAPELASAYRTAIGETSANHANLFMRSARLLRGALWASAPRLCRVLEVKHISPQFRATLENVVAGSLPGFLEEYPDKQEAA